VSCPAAVWRLLRSQSRILEAAEKVGAVDEQNRCANGGQGVEAPLNQIAVNAGLEGGVIVDKVRNLAAHRRVSMRRPVSTRTF